jgi:hypothetical protein
LNDLRAQVDLSLVELIDYPIVCSFPVTWQTIGAGDRLLNVESEYAMLLKCLAVGLSTTEEMLTGAATYGGTRFTMELMNTQYLNFRELMRMFVEKCFVPESVVRMADGTQRRIDSLQVGDQVYSGSGNVCSVEFVGSRSVDEEVCVIDARGLTSPLRVTKGHLLLTPDGWVPSEEVTKNTVLLLQPDREEVACADVTDDHAYLMGWYAAEGCLVRDPGENVTDGVVFSLGAQKYIDQLAVPRITDALHLVFPPEDFGALSRQQPLPVFPDAKPPVRRIPLSDSYTGPCPRCGSENKWLRRCGVRSGGVPRVRCCRCRATSSVTYVKKCVGESFTSGGSVKLLRYNNQDAHEFFGMECPGLAETKVLQARWMRLPLHQQKIMLQAWLLGAGHIKESRITYGCSSSRRLRDQMMWVAARLGFKSTPFVQVDGKHVSEVSVRDLDPDSLFGLIYGFRISAADAQRLWDDEVDHGLPSTNVPQKACMSRENVRKLGFKARGSRWGPNWWTPEREQTLKSSYLTQGAVGCALALETTVPAVVARAKKLGLWTRVWARPLGPVTQPTETAALPVVVTETRTEHYTGLVYDIRVSDDHTFQVEGAVVHNCYFRPVALAHGHYYYEKIDTWVRVRAERVRAGDDLIEEYDGRLRKRKTVIQRKYNHSRVRFNRLSIRDNAEVYDQLFQLHQKGSVALRWLLDIHNIDSEENSQALLEDVATNRDPTFNRILEGAYTALAERLANDTDLFDRIKEGLNLDTVSKLQGQPGPGTPVEQTQQGGMGSLGTDTFGGGVMGGGGMGGGLGGGTGEDLGGGMGGGLGGPQEGLPGAPGTLPGESPGLGPTNGEAPPGGPPGAPGTPAPAPTASHSRDSLPLPGPGFRRLSPGEVHRLASGRRPRGTRRHRRELW